jgi:hypothetical protein
MFVVQEKTPERRIVVCVMPSIERAQSFVDERLATYDKMWDG